MQPESWLLELEDIEKDTSRLVTRLTVSNRKPKSTKNKFKQGQVLYGKLRPYLNKIIIADKDGYCSTEIVPFPQCSQLDERYLFYWLKSPTFLDYTDQVSHGINMPRLGTKAGNEAPFIIAPLAEQRRIADKLDTTLAAVEACKQKLNKAAETIQRFRQSVLAAAVSGELTREWREHNTAGIDISASDKLERATLPEGYRRLKKQAIKESKASWPKQDKPEHWKIVSIETLYKLNYILDFADGNHGSLYPRKSEFSNKGITFLTATQITSKGKIKFNECPLLNHEKASQLTKGWARKGDVILTHNATVGRCAIVDQEIEPFLLGTSATFYRLNESHINPGYAWIFFLSSYFQRQLRSCMEQTTRDQVPITKQATLGFILPPIDEQDEIWRLTKSLLQTADDLEDKLRKATQYTSGLSSAVLAKAFRGELVPQDPNDEPASVLLARIKAQREAEAATKKPAKRGRKEKADTAQLAIPAGIADNHLAKVLEECGALSKRALLAASELEPGVFQLQLTKELAAGGLKQVDVDGEAFYAEAAWEE